MLKLVLVFNLIAYNSIQLNCLMAKWGFQSPRKASTITVNYDSLLLRAIPKQFLISLYTSPIGFAFESNTFLTSLYSDEVIGTFVDFA